MRDIEMARKKMVEEAGLPLSDGTLQGEVHKVMRKLHAEQQKLTLKALTGRS